MADQKKKQRENKATARQNDKRKYAPEDARSRLAGKTKTIEATINYQSDFMHSYLTRHEMSTLNIFERLGAIFRMARSDKEAYAKVRDWHYETNIAIAEMQIETLQEQREQIAANAVLASENTINVPDSYKIVFELSHPVGNTITQLIKSLDSELAEIEKVFMNGLMDDLEYEQASRQAIAVMSGVVDRIYKVTSPGKRDNGPFSPALYMKYLKDPTFDLHERTDIPRELREAFPQKKSSADVKTEKPTETETKPDDGKPESSDKAEALNQADKTEKETA